MERQTHSHILRHTEEKRCRLQNEPKNETHKHTYQRANVLKSASDDMCIHVIRRGVSKNVLHCVCVLSQTLNRKHADTHTSIRLLVLAHAIQEIAILKSE